MLKGKKIVLGVTGSIAAYKAAILIRLLIKEGAEVKVIMTDLARQFITPLSLATLSKNPVLVEFFNPENGDWNSHVDLGIWADAFLIAPATANTIGKMAHGIADNLLLTTYLSARCPVFIAPAMDLDMFNHVATQENIRVLTTRGHSVIEPATGELASGLDGKGRMEEPDKIVDILRNYFSINPLQTKHSENLKGKKVLISAGPTFEPIDPVRFVGNHSTGKMGYAIAEAFALAGADVTLITGPSHITVSNAIKKIVRVQTAAQMYEQCALYFTGSSIIIFTAAVADYRPKLVANNKIKSIANTFSIELEKTVDIAFELGKLKKPNQFTVGFALETENEIENAKKKIEKKNFDLLVLNSLQDEGAGFGHDTNKVTIIDKDNNITKFGLKSKHEVAKDILGLVSEKII